MTPAPPPSWASRHERVAGLVLIGTPTEAPLERVRPDVDAITTVWSPG